jgi:hypothetical protein
MHAQGRETGLFVDGERNNIKLYDPDYLYTRSWGDYLRK